MRKTEGGITPFQLFFVILQTTIGVEVLSLPNEIFQISKNDAWISILVAGLIAQAGIILVWLLHRRFSSSTIFEIFSTICGNRLGMVGKIVYIVYFVFMTLYVVLIFAKILNMWILIHTPIWITMFLVIAVGAYCAQKSLRVVARFFTVISMLLILSIVLYIYVLRDVNYLHLLPIGESGIPLIMKGAVKATLAFSGFEIVLVIYPLTVGNPSKKLKVSLLAIGVITIFYTYLTLLSLAFFGPGVMKFLPQPLLYMLKYQTLHVVERTDLLFLSVWTTSVTTSVIMYLYLASTGIADLLKKPKHHARYVWYTATVVFISSLFVPKDNETLRNIAEYYMKVSALFLFIIPGTLLLLSFVLRKKEKQRGTET